MTLKEIIKSYITNKKINIPEDDWTKIKEEYDKQEVIDTFASVISKGYIKMPLTDISLEEALLAEKELSEQDFFYQRRRVLYSI